jgi:hypothetical protein
LTIASLRAALALEDPLLATMASIRLVVGG